MSVGKVYLVGAGPGDPGLITVAAVERLGEADVVVYDRLASPQLLDHCRPDAELIYVGKVAGESHDQRAINRLLIEKARPGKKVVRLKGGDPFVFGRGGEEAEALLEAGIPFEVIPGVTSAVAVPAYAGIPVTHRAVAVSFAVVTGHEDPTKEESGIHWEHLATGVDTLVFLMGMKNLPEVVDKLIANGRPAETPAAVIHRGTHPEQRTVVGTLSDILQKVEDAGLRPPSITVVGEVVRLRETLNWFEDRPLFGKKVLITRTRAQASALAKSLAEEGAVPIELPAIEIEPGFEESQVDQAVRSLQARSFAWAIFTSVNGVDLFFRLLERRGLDARVFGGVKVAAIGPATAETLRERGIRADVVPPEYVAESILQALSPQVHPKDRVLVPRAENARPELIEGLRAGGAEVEELILYRAAVPREPPEEALSLLRDGAVDIVTFTSSSTVRNLAAILDGDLTCLSRSLTACIGPVTAKTAEELGLRVDVLAEEHTIPGLVQAIKAKLGGG